jgi:phenylpropionate dioxygenase-like ring-hydroxylating dioxygenase large terminal subunit
VTVITTEVRRILADFQDSTGPLETALTPPPEIYTSDEFWNWEREAVFAREWNCVGREDEIPNPGDFFTVDVAGEPVIVTRNHEGEIRAMSAVCRHRAACVTAPATRPIDDLQSPLGHDVGNVRSFKCPYHWWVYDLDGRLIGAPEMNRTEGFSLGDVRLPPFRVERWQGFIFVNLDPDAEPLGPQLTPIDAIARTYQIGELVSVAPDEMADVPFNWKVMTENFLDAYHASRLHAGLHDFAPSINIVDIPFEEDSAVVAGWSRNTATDAGFNPGLRALMPVIPGLPQEYRDATFFAAIVPNVLIIAQVDMVIVFVLRPTGPASHDLKLYYLIPQSTTKLRHYPEVFEYSKLGFIPLTEQDMATNISVQRGLASPFFERGRYSWQESMIGSYNRLLGRRYLAAADGAPAGSDPTGRSSG